MYKRVSCNNCGNILQYTSQDTYEHKYGYDYLGDYEVGKAIKCPCGKDVIVRG